MKDRARIFSMYLGADVIFKGETWKLKSVELGVNGNLCGKVTRKRPDRQTWDLENYEFRNGEEPIELVYPEQSLPQLESKLKGADVALVSLYECGYTGREVRAFIESLRIKIIELDDNQQSIAVKP